MTAQSEVSLEGVRVVEAGEQGAPGNKAGEGVAKAGEGEVARRRASLPLEARQSEFKEMLLERGVRVGGLRVRVGGLRVRVGGLRVRVGGRRVRVGELRVRVGGRRDGVGLLKASVVVLEVRVDLDEGTREKGETESVIVIS